MNFYKIIQQNHILFWLFIVFLHHIILYVVERTFFKKLKELIMTIDDKIRNEKMQYSTNGKATKNWLNHQVKLINMNILQVRKYCLLNKI